MPRAENILLSAFLYEIFLGVRSFIQQGECFMKLKKTFVIGLAVLFSACSEGEVGHITEAAFAETTTSAVTAAGTEWEDAELMPEMFSGYAFTGNVIVSDDESGTRTVYSGDISDDGDVSAAEDFIASIEAMPHSDTSEFYDTFFNGTVASISLEKDGERYTYTERRYTENGVGVCCILRTIYGRDSFCVRFEDSGENSLYFLMTELIAKEENISESQKYPEKNDVADIVLISEYKNYAWGYQHSGSFIDMNGNVFDFDFSSDTYGGEEIDSDAELLQRLTEICSEERPQSDAFGGYTDTLREIRELADGADRDAKLISEFDCFDAGQSTVYAVTSGNRLVTVCSDGDYIVTSTDEKALEIRKLWEDMICLEE